MLNSLKVGFFIILFTTLLFAIGKPGVINGTISLQPFTADEALRSIASYYYHRLLNISSESGNIKVTTKYGSGYWLVSFYNNSASTATIRFKCIGDTAIIIYKLPAYTPTIKLAPVDSIYQAGTSDSLITNFQRQ